MRMLFKAELIAALLPFAVVLPVAMPIADAAPQESTQRQDAGMRRVRVTGAGTGHDPAKARDAAIQDALRRAVEEGLGVLVDARTLSENYQLVKDEVLIRSQGLVRSYRILHEFPENGAIKVQIEAEVSLKALGTEVENLADRLKLGTDPRIVLLLDAGESDDTREWAESAESHLTANLTEMGFTVKDVAVAERAKVRETVALALDGQDVSAARRALMPMADIFILGRVTAREEKSVRLDGERYSAATAKCDLRAVHADTGTIIARFTAASPQQISLTGPSQAMEKAVQKATQKWQEQCGGKLICAGIDPMRCVTITFQRVDSATVVATTQYLRTLRNTRNIRIRDREQNLTLVEVEWSGETADLTAQLESQKRLGLRAVAHTANTARITTARPAVSDPKTAVQMRKMNL